jgi:hypothetical protein
MKTARLRHWLRTLAALAFFACVAGGAAAPAGAAQAGPERGYMLDLLSAAPAAVDGQRAFFAVAGDYASYQEAMLGLAALRRQAPDVHVAVFPPYGEWRSWSIMAASYASRDDARYAVDYLTDQRLSTGAYLRSVADQAGRPIRWLPEPESQRGKIVACLGQGVATIGAMAACAGAIVTPESLTRCLAGGICTLDLDIVDAGTYLAARNLNFDTPLKVETGGAFSPEVVRHCVDTSADAPAAMVCLATSDQGTIDTACLGKTGEAATSCLVGQHLGADAEQVYACVAAARTPAGVGRCANGGASPGMERVQACVAGQTDVQAALAQCMPDLADASQRAFIGCVSRLRVGTTPPQECLASRPDWAKPVQMGLCLRDAKASVGTILGCARRGGLDVSADVSACVTAIGNGNPAACAAAAAHHPVVECVSRLRGNPDDLWVCLSQGDPNARQAVETFRCLSSGNQAAGLIATCGAAFLPPETRQVAGCLSRAGGAATASAACVATRYMGKEEARLVNCAANAQGYVSFGLCAVGTGMNQEWRMTAECVAAGGAPPVVAGCVAGRLTAAELEKCFTKGIGGDGCFGNNNTLVLGLRNAADDLTKGPGPNNDIVKGLNAIGNAFNSLF